MPSSEQEMRARAEEEKLVAILQMWIGDHVRRDVYRKAAGAIADSYADIVQQNSQLQKHCDEKSAMILRIGGQLEAAERLNIELVEALRVLSEGELNVWARAIVKQALEGR